MCLDWTRPDFQTSNVLLTPFALALDTSKEARHRLVGTTDLNLEEIGLVRVALLVDARRCKD